MLRKERLIGEEEVADMGVAIRRFDGQQDESKTDDVVL